MYAKDDKIILCFIKYVKTSIRIQITCNGRVDATSGGSAFNVCPKVGRSGGKQSALRLLSWKLRCNTMSIQSCTCTVHINGLSVALLSESHAPSNTTQKPLRLLVFVLMFEKLPFIIACKVLRQLAMPSIWCSKPRHSTKRWWHNSAVQSHFLIIQITYSWLNDKDSSCAANPRLTTSTRGHPIIH